MAGFIDNAGEFTLLDSWILLKKHSSTTTIYSITWLNRNSRGQLFYFSLEIFPFKKGKRDCRQSQPELNARACKRTRFTPRGQNHRPVTVLYLCKRQGRPILYQNAQRNQSESQDQIYRSRSKPSVPKCTEK